MKWKPTSFTKEAGPLVLKRKEKKNSPDTTKKNKMQSQEVPVSRDLAC